MKIPHISLKCPVCNSELQYTLYVEPLKTKHLKCNWCKTKVTIPINIFKNLLGGIEK